MRPLAYLGLVAAAHIAFLFGAYGTGFFSLTRFLPYAVVLAMWLGLSSVLAGWGYFKIAASLLDSTLARLLLSATAVAISLYAGVFFAFNTFGT
jgi:hypothetical protein